MALLADVGEFPFIEAIKKLVQAEAPRRGVRVGIGDDAAALSTTATTLATTDAVVEGVHFLRDWLTPAQLGRRAFRVAVSDIAAMGGKPRYVLAALALPAGYRLADARALVASLIRDAAGVGAALVGGNVSRADKISITITVLGQPSRGALLRRSGARRGDAVYLTGCTGMAAAGVELLKRGVSRGVLVSAYRSPPLHLDLAARLAGSGVVSAAIDVSDGLLQDLQHICRASGVDVQLDESALALAPALARAGLEREPLSYALSGGEDYELLFSVRGGERANSRVESLCSDAGCRLSRIGEVVAASSTPGVRGVSQAAIAEPGYEHFGHKT